MLTRIPNRLPPSAHPPTHTQKSLGGFVKTKGSPAPSMKTWQRGQLFEYH